MRARRFRRRKRRRVRPNLRGLSRPWFRAAGRGPSGSIGLGASAKVERIFVERWRCVGLDALLGADVLDRGCVASGVSRYVVSCARPDDDCAVVRRIAFVPEPVGPAGGKQLVAQSVRIEVSRQPSRIVERGRSTHAPRAAYHRRAGGGACRCRWWLPVGRRPGTARS